jgi:hypothetical protein
VLVHSLGDFRLENLHDFLRDCILQRQLASLAEVLLELFADIFAELRERVELAYILDELIV